MQVARAVILKSLPFSENQNIIHAFSLERGFMSFITPASLFKRKNNNSIQYMQIVEIEFIFNERGNLHKLKSVSTLKNTSAIYFDILKMNVALLWGEVLSLLLKDQEANETLYNYIENSVDYLSSEGCNTANFNLFFLYRINKLLGFKINTESYNSGYGFNMNDGDFYPESLNSQYNVGPNAAKIIYELCSCKLDELENIMLDQISRQRLLDIAFIFWKIHLNLNFDTKSIQIIREVFS